MSTVFDCIENVVNDALHHTDDEITAIQKNLLPQIVDVRYKFLRTRQYRYNNDMIKDENHLIIKIDGLREKFYNVTKKEDTIYILNMIEAINTGKIHPFALFINGKHVNWTDITIVKDARYTYLLVPRNPFKTIEEEIMTIKSLTYIYFPIPVFYTETRSDPPNSNYTQIFRFSLEGEMVDHGKVIYYIDHPDVRFGEYRFASGQVNAYDLEIDHNVKLTANNFFIFKNRLLDTTSTVAVDRLNLLYLNGEDDAKYTIKTFYRTDVNKPYNIINKFKNVQLAKDMVQGKVKNPRVDTKILNTPFNFTQDQKKDYNSNIKYNFRYMTAYDSAFLTKIYEMTNTVETKSYTGKEIRSKVNLFGILNMLLLKYKEKMTRVLVFCNGLLYKHYSDISYHISSFTMPIDLDELKDDDRFEFVFLKGINNWSEIIRYNNSTTPMSFVQRASENKDEAAPFEVDELLLYSRDPHEHRYKDKVRFNTRSWFNVPFEVNEDGAVIVDEYYNNKEILYTTRNQFKYLFRNISKESLKIRLTPDFQTSMNINQYMVFVNGRFLNKSFYRLILPARDQAFTDPYLYSRVKFHPGDKVEVIYGPIEFKDIDDTGNMTTSLVSMYPAKPGQRTFVIPYPFKLYTNREDFMLFINNEFCSNNRYVVQNGLLILQDGTVVQESDKLTFAFIYDKCDEQESAIYVNDKNGIYCENIYLEVENDGQTVYDLKEDRYIDYLMAGNSIMVTYHGLYVPSEYYTINRYTGILTFAPNTFERGDFLNVIIFYISDNVNEISKTITPINTTYELDITDLSNFPISYYVQMPFDQVVADGAAETRNKVIVYAEEMLDSKTRRYLNSVMANTGSSDIGNTFVLPFEYRDHTFYVEFLNNGGDYTKERIIAMAKALINSKLRTDLSYSDIEDKLYKAYTIGFPYVHYWSLPWSRFMTSSRETIYNLTVDHITKFLDSKERGTASTSQQEAFANGIVKTETAITSNEDNKTEFDDDDITGFPIMSTTSIGFDQLERMDINEFYNSIKNNATSMIDIRLDSSDTDGFDIGEYIRNGKPLFIMKNGVLLTEGYHYTLVKELNKIKFTEPVDKGDTIYLVTYDSTNYSIRSYEHTITVKDPNQRQYDLYNIFGSLTNAKHRFMIYVNSIILDPRRYDLDKNCLLTFHDDVHLEEGQHIYILALYVDEGQDSAYSYNYLGSSRYHKVRHVQVPFESDTYTYDIPYPSNAERDCGFILMCGAELIDETRYTVDRHTMTITFVNQADPMFIDNTEFTFVFLYDDMRTLTVSSALGDRIVDDRYGYNIPVPFSNYFDVGNNIMVFAGSTLLDPERYTIDTKNKIIYLKDSEYLSTNYLRYIYVYHKHSKNIALTDESVSITTIRKNGYVFLNKSKLDHPLAKSLFWMFMNGKKVPVEDIIDISTNLVKINKDQRSRYNLMMISHTPRLGELDEYFASYSNYDTLINNLDVEDLNALFNSHRLLSDTEVKFDMGIKREALINEIVRDWYVRTNIHNGDSFVNSYEDPSTYGTQYLDEETHEIHNMIMDASKYFSAKLDRSDINSDATQD